MLDIIEDKIEEIVNLIEKTGDFIVQEQKSGGYQKFIKEDGTLLTELDLASNIMICNGLERIFGKIPIVSEENEYEENIIAAKEDYCFVVDPIDGTKSFDKGGGFTINLGFCYKRNPIFGLICEPKERRLFFTSNGKTFKKENDKIKQLEKVRSYDNDKKDIIILTGLNSLLDDNFNDLFQKEMLKTGYNIPSVMQSSAMTKLNILIEQKCDMIFIKSKCKDWDILPVIPILKNHGISFSNLQGNIIFLSQDSNFAQEFFIASYDKSLIQDIRRICQGILLK